MLTTKQTLTPSELIKHIVLKYPNLTVNSIIHLLILHLLTMTY